MRNKIFGVIGVVWGGLILINYFTKDAPPSGNAAREAGSMAGLILGGLMLVAGLYTLVKSKPAQDEKS